MNSKARQILLDLVHNKKGRALPVADAKRAVYAALEAEEENPSVPTSQISEVLTRVGDLFPQQTLLGRPSSVSNAMEIVRRALVEGQR